MDDKTRMLPGDRPHLVTGRSIYDEGMPDFYIGPFVNRDLAIAFCNEATQAYDGYAYHYHRIDSPNRHLDWLASFSKDND